MPTKRNCLVCGRFAEVTANKWCRPPEPDFETNLAEMPAAEIELALLHSDTNFCEQLDRLICQMMRGTYRVEAEAAAEQQKLTQPAQSYVSKVVSEDSDRYGSKVEVETSDGTQEVDVDDATDVYDPKLDTDKAAEKDKNEKEKTEDDKTEDDDDGNDDAEPVAADLEKIAEVQQAEAADDAEHPEAQQSEAVDAESVAVEQSSEWTKPPQRTIGIRSQEFRIPTVMRRVNGKVVPDPVAPYGRDLKTDRPIIGPLNYPRLLMRPPSAQAKHKDPNLCEHWRPKDQCIYCATGAPPLRYSPAELRRINGPTEEALRIRRIPRSPALTVAAKHQAAYAEAERVLGITRAKSPVRQQPLPPIKPKEPAFQPEPGESWDSYFASARWEEYQKQMVVYDEQLRQYENRLNRQDHQRSGRFISLLRVCKPTITSLDVVSWLDEVVEPEHDIDESIPDQIVPMLQAVLIEPVEESKNADELHAQIKDLEQEKVKLGSPKQFLKKRLIETNQFDLANDPKERRNRANALTRDLAWHDEEIKKLKHELDKVKQILKDRDKHPRYRMEERPTFVPGKVVIKHIPATTFRQLIIEKYGSDKLGGYESAARDGEVHQNKLDGFENRLIRIAIRAGVFKPDNLAEMRKRYPWIDKWWDSAAAVEDSGKENAAGDAEDADQSGNQSIFKTGGASEGLSIHGRGKDAQGGQRPLDSFDRGQVKTGGGGEDQPGESSDVESDDYSEDSNS